MDIMLPDMDGIEAINSIKEQDPNAKIMMCSSVGNAASIVKAINAGAREFILKPFQPARVLNAVENILG
jgi:two-component system chemotaxis response regulator CheY